MLTQKWPIRIGLLPIVPGLAGSTRVDAGAGEASASERMGRLLAMAAQSLGPAAAARFLAELRGAVPASEDESPGSGDAIWARAQAKFTSRWSAWAAEAGARAAGKLAGTAALEQALQVGGRGEDVGQGRRPGWRPRAAILFTLARWAKPLAS